MRSSPQRDPQILSRDVVGIIRWWFVGDREVAEGAVEEVLDCGTKGEARGKEVETGQRLLVRFGSVFRLLYQTKDRLISFTLRYDFPRFRYRERQLTSILLSMSNSTTMTRPMEKAIRRFRGSFSPSARRQ